MLYHVQPLNQCSNIILNINIPLKIVTRFHGRTKNKYNPTITDYIKEYIATHAILDYFIL